MRSDALITCVVAGVKYLIHPQKLGSIDATIDSDALVPVTLLTTSQIFDGDVDALLKLYDVYDDVFIPEFGGVLVEKTPSNTAEARAAPNGKQLQRLSNDSVVKDFEQLPSGPYFLYGPNLYEAWRLYADDLDAFTTGVIPEEADSPKAFRPLASLDITGRYRAVAVPSKLYHPPPGASGPGKPLSGVRVAVSDAVSINGVPESLSSRSWADMYPFGVDKSAKIVDKLISMGAVIVGKTKTSQFTVGRDWIDASASFSTRGDQYHRLMGSSAGSSASLSGYQWLSYVIADDDRGDIFDLSSQEGLFSLRPSSKALPLKGSKLASHSFSSLALSGRILDQLLSITQAVLGPSKPSSYSITQLIRLVDLEAGLEGQEKALYEEFVQAMENQVGVKSRPKDLAKAWKAFKPKDKDKGLHQTVNETSFLVFCDQFYQEFAAFRNAYEEKSGHAPFTEPHVARLWSVGAETTKDEVEAAQKTIQEFREWFRQSILPDDSSAAIVLPVKLAPVVYRGEPLLSVIQQDLLKSNGLSALTGLPGLSAPFAQVPFKSRITKREEYRTLSASVIGRHGSDTALLELVRNAYHLAQWRSRVDTGRLAFPLGDNQRNVDDSQLACKEIEHPGLPEEQEAESSVADAWEAWEL